MNVDNVIVARSLVDNKEAVVRVTRDWLAAGARCALYALPYTFTYIVTCVGLC